MRQTAAPIANLNIDVMVATREFTYTVPFNCKVAELHTAADSNSTSDYATVTMTYAGTTIMTAPAILAADADYSTTGADGGQLDFLPSGALIKLVVTVTGTASNIKGVVATLWAERKR